jgi:hypothetical protein
MTIIILESLLLQITCHVKRKKLNCANSADNRRKCSKVVTELATARVVSEQRVPNERSKVDFDSVAVIAFCLQDMSRQAAGLKNVVLRTKWQAKMRNAEEVFIS